MVPGFACPPAQRRRGGFSLIELVIVAVIIGIIAAIAIPRLSHAARNASEKSLEHNLSALRRAIEIYAAEHDGKYPDEAIVQQLTGYSDLSGHKLSATRDRSQKVIYGPYLDAIPPLPVGPQAGSDAINVVTGTGNEPTGGSGGWWYNKSTRRLTANLSATVTDNEGVPFNQY